MSAEFDARRGLHEIASALAATEREYGYWLIDPALGDVDDGCFSAWPEVCRFRLPVVHPDVAKLSAPYLIQAPESAFELEKFLLVGAERAIEEACADIPPGLPRPRRFCAFLLSDMAGEVLARQLGRAAVVSSEHSVRQLFRFWDPRVLGFAQASEQLSSLLPGEANTQWLYFDGSGTHQVFVASEEIENTARARPLTPRQVSELNAIGQCNRVMEMLRGLDDTNLASLPLDVISRAVSVSNTLGLAKTADRLAFCVARVRHRAPIEYSDRIASLIAAASHGASYQALQNELTSEDWSVITTESLQIEARQRQANN